MMERAINVAQYICTEYKKISGENIEEMKLHRLLYLIQRESIALTGEPMFAEEFEGWRYGPVCREVIGEYMKGRILQQNPEDISLESAYIAKNIILQYGAYASWKLNELFHKELSWRNARQGMKPEEDGSQTLALEDIRKDSEKVRPYDSVWDMYYDEFEDAEEV